MKLTAKEIINVENHVQKIWNQLQLTDEFNREFIKRLIRSWRAELGHQKKQAHKHNILIMRYYIDVMIRLHLRYLKRESY